MTHNSKTTKHAGFSLSLMFLAVLSANQAFAADSGTESLEEIIVTVQKKTERLQKTPVAVTAIQQKTVIEERITALADIGRVTPSLDTQVSPSSGAMLSSMRGIPYIDYQSSGDYSVGSYVDGVFVPQGFATVLGNSDIERIEVMRGPQGTLYGRNSTAGGINIITRRPMDDFAGSFTQTIGQNGLNESTVKIDTGRHAGFAARGSITTARSDGYIDNPDESRNWDSRDNTFGNLSVDYVADNGIYAKYSYLSGENDNPQPAFQLLEIDANARNRLIASGYPGFLVDAMILPQAKDAASKKNLEMIDTPTDDAIQENEFSAHILEVKAPINDNLSIKSISGYREQEIKNPVDFAKADIDFFGMKFYDAFAGPDDGYYASRFASQEFQLLGTAAEGTVDYILGVYLSTQSADEKVKLSAGPGIVIMNYDNTLTTDTSAIFGQAEWRPTWDWSDNKLHLIGGARYSMEDKEIDKNGLGTVFNGFTSASSKTGDDFSDISPTFIVGWDFDAATYGYAKASQAFKSGGFDTSSGRMEAVYNTPYDDEKATTYEVGLKKDMLDNRLRINGAAYYTDFSDMQIGVVPNLMIPAERATINAGQVDIHGLELDATAVLAAGLTATVGYAYTDYTINEVIDQHGTMSGMPGSNVADDFVLPNVNKHKTYIATEYRMDKTVVGRPVFNASYAWQDEADSFYWAGNPNYAGMDMKTDAFGVLNASAALTEIPLGGEVSGTVRLWATNLTDEEYVDTKNPTLLGVTGHFGEERTIGLDLTVKF